MKSACSLKSMNWLAILFFGGLAHLGTGLCRATYTPSPATRICLSEEVWQKWLKRPDQSTTALSGQWKAFSPLENFPQREPIARKRAIEVLRVSTLPSPSAWIRMLEQKRDSLSHALAPHDPTGLLRTLLLSESPPNLPNLNEPQLLHLAGFLHLLSISGIHLFFLARAITWLCRALLAPVAGVESGILVARVLSIAAWIWVWLMAGARLTQFGPLLLLSSRLFTKAQGLKWRNGVPLSIVLLIAAYIAPGGTIVLGLAITGARLIKEGWLSKAVGAWSFVALWQCFRFGLVTALSPLLGLLIAPAFVGILYPILALGSMLPISFFKTLLFLLSRPIRGADLLVTTLERINLNLPALWVVSRQSFWIGAWLSLGVALLRFIYPKTKPATWMLILASAALMARAARPADSPGPEVEQLDVGQGDAALVKTGASTGLIDTGSEKSLRAADWVTLLAERGIRRIDWIALTHLDEDHAGGARTLVKTLPVGCIETSREEIDSPRGIRLREYLAAESVSLAPWGSGCVPAPVLTLAPPAEQNGKNAHMGALLVPLEKGHWFLSMGDAEGKDELALSRRALAQMGEHPALTLKLSHHGSKTSSSDEVLDLLRPARAVVSDGIGNPFGHPAPEVLARLQRRRIPLFRTDQMGSIRFD